MKNKKFDAPLSNEEAASTEARPRLADARYVPILFSGEMVNALLADQKKLTRRICDVSGYSGFKTISTTRRIWDSTVEANPNPIKTEAVFNLLNVEKEYRIKSKWQVGDILWVRETLYQNGELGLEYAADKEDIDEEIIPLDFNVRTDKNGNYKFCKIPNIYMEKWACRIFLKVKSIRVERLHAITTADIEAEGIRYPGHFVLGKENSALSFLPAHVNLKDTPPTHDEIMFALWAELWCKINGRKSWDSNPWVWVIGFERIERPTGFC